MDEEDDELSLKIQSNHCACEFKPGCSSVTPEAMHDTERYYCFNLFAQKRAAESEF